MYMYVSSSPAKVCLTADSYLSRAKLVLHNMCVSGFFFFAVDEFSLKQISRLP